MPLDDLDESVWEDLVTEQANKTAAKVRQGRQRALSVASALTSRSEKNLAELSGTARTGTTGVDIGGSKPGPIKSIRAMRTARMSRASSRSGCVSGCLRLADHTSTHTLTHIHTDLAPGGTAMQPATGMTTRRTSAVVQPAAAMKTTPRPTQRRLSAPRRPSLLLSTTTWPWTLLSSESPAQRRPCLASWMTRPTMWKARWAWALPTLLVVCASRLRERLLMQTLNGVEGPR